MTALSPNEIAFRHWWLAYPLKMAVAEARVAFNEALKLTDVATLIEGAHRLANDPNRDPGYTPYPSKWLHGQRWMDGALPPRKPTPEDAVKREVESIKAREEAQRQNSERIEKETAEAKLHAVPLDPELKAATLAQIQRNLYPDS